MENLPLYIPLVFGATLLSAVWFFYIATRKSRVALLVIVGWFILQSGISLSGFYTVTQTLPPRFGFLLLPPLFLIIGLFLTNAGKQFLDALNKPLLSLLHVLRVPIELVLFWLFFQGTVPQLMTFEGRNFDILAGLSAPVIYYFGFIKHRLPVSFLLGWNFICLGLLFNIVIHGILSVPTPFQQFGFDQPNIALTYFPYIFLPGFLVPLVLFSHLASIQYLLAQKQLVKSSQLSKAEVV